MKIPPVVVFTDKLLMTVSRGSVVVPMPVTADKAKVAAVTSVSSAGPSEAVLSKIPPPVLVIVTVAPGWLRATDSASRKMSPGAVKFKVPALSMPFTVKATSLSLSPLPTTRLMAPTSDFTVAPA